MSDSIVDQIVKWTKSIDNWMAVIDVWTAAASDSIEKLEEKVQKLEEHEARYREGRVEERIAALEQIYNKSKQAPAPQYTNCHCSVCSPPKADPGPGFYYCPSCGTRQITGSFHYCAGKTYPPEGFGHGSAATPAATYTAPEGGQRGAAPLCGPESAPVPAPPLGGQTEEEIRKAARIAAGKPWTSGFVYRVDY